MSNFIIVNILLNESVTSDDKEHFLSRDTLDRALDEHLRIELAMMSLLEPILKNKQGNDSDGSPQASPKSIKREQKCVRFRDEITDDDTHRRQGLGLSRRNKTHNDSIIAQREFSPPSTRGLGNNNSFTFYCNLCSFVAFCFFSINN